MSLFLKTLLQLLIGLFAICLMAVAGLGYYIYSIMPELPDIESIRDIKLKVPLRIYTSDGALIAEYGDERRMPVSIDTLPETLVDAILAAEDNGFYQHPGIDVTGIARAAIANLRSGGRGQGASTITMQVARNYFLTPERTYSRKMKEILLAFRIENALSKDQILELYINKIFLGHRSYGFAAAARVYYGKTLEELTLPEIAMLAGLPKAPSKTNPLTNPARAKNRRNYVLRRMFDLDRISRDMYIFASGTDITATRHATKVDLDAPYIAEQTRQYMTDNYGENAYTDGFRVFTTIRSDLQLAANHALREGLIAYDKRHGYRGPVKKVKMAGVQTNEQFLAQLENVPRSKALVPALVLGVEKKSAILFSKDGERFTLEWKGISWARKYKSARSLGAKPKSAREVLRPGHVVYVQKTDKNQWVLRQIPDISGALVSLDPKDGRIIALAGGFDYYLSKFNRATQALRQPGSNIKPFIYSAAIEKGFTASSLVSGAPIVVQDNSLQEIWRPENYSKKIFGPTRLRRALTLSLNLVSVRLLRAITPQYALQYLERFGFTRDQLPNGLSLALGSATATPLNMATAYTVFANGGYLVEPFLIDRIENGKGEIQMQSNPETVCRTCPVMPPETRTEKGALPTSEIEASETKQRLARRVVSEDNVFIMTSIMRDVIKSGTGRKAMSLKRNDLAGKTGTTNNFRDAWFSGFNQDVVSTVWVGFDQPADLGRGEAGSRASLPIWIDYMRVALTGIEEKPLTPPDSIVRTYVHKATGRPVAAGNPDAYPEYFIVGTVPEADRNRIPENSDNRGTGGGTITETLF